MLWTIRAVIGAALVGLLGGAFRTFEPPTDAAARASATNTAATAVIRPQVEWAKRTEVFMERTRTAAEKGDIDVIFLGDSITQGWEGAGKPVWDEFYGKRRAVNYGISGDRTQHVLWRIQRGSLDGLAKPALGNAPKLVVLLIGTNNSHGADNTAAEIAGGIKACVATVREKLPETKVLLLSIFPRGEKPSAQREKNAEASRLAAAAADGEKVFSLDIGAKFVGKDGAIDKELMPDAVHLSEKGYRVWAEEMEGKVKEFLGTVER